MKVLKTKFISIDQTKTLENEGFKMKDISIDHAKTLSL